MRDFSYVTGGTLAPGAPSYVGRTADRELLSHLESGETCYVLNSRQMGKSSLCVRTIGKLKDQGVRTVFLDLTKFGGRNLSAEQWYAALLSEAGRELGLRSELLAYWKENLDLPAVQRFFGSLVEVGLPSGSGIVVFIDEIDVTLSLPFSADEFFAAIRQCYVGRATDERLKRLSFCLLGTATPADLIQDTRVSPFNIGKRIELRDFTSEEAKPLAAGLGDSVLLDRILYWTGGHPYLTQRLCHAVMDSQIKDVDRVCSDLFLTHAAKDGDDNLAFVRNRLLKSEADLAALLDLYKKMRTGKHVRDDETNPLCALLKLSGVAKVEGGVLKVRNRIYEHVFDRDWVETHMPHAEQRRQKEAYRRGLFRAASVGLGVAGAIAFLAIQAIRAGQATEAARKDLDYQLYVSRMNNLQLFHSEGNGAQMEKVLEETRQSPFRGWEWGYWNGVLHDASEEYALDSSEPNPVVGAAFSQDGKQIMLTDLRLRVTSLVDRGSRTVVAQYPLRRDDQVFRCGSRWLAFDLTTVRDIVSGKVLFHCIPAKGQNSYVTPLGDRLISEVNGDAERTTVYLHDINTGRIVFRTASQYPHYPFFTGASSTGARFIEGTARYNGTEFSCAVIDKNGRAIHPSVRVDEGICSISSSGRLFVYKQANMLTIYDLDRHRLVNTLAGEHCIASNVDKSDTYLITLWQDGRLSVRSIHDGKVVAEHRGVRQFSESPNTGELMLCGSTIRVVPIIERKAAAIAGNFMTRTTKHRFINAHESGYEFRSDPDLRLVGGPFAIGYPSLISLDGRMRAVFEQTDEGKMSVLRDADSGEILLKSKLGWSIAAAPLSGDHYVTLSVDGMTLEGHRRGESKPIWVRNYVTDRLGGFSMIYMSADGNRVLRALHEQLEVLDGRSGRLLKTYSIGLSTGLGFVGQTSDFWVCNSDGVEIFDGTTFGSIKKSELASIYALDASPDGRRFVTSDTDGGVSVWDSKTFVRLARISATSNAYVGSIVFTSDGKKVIGADSTAGLRVLESKDDVSITRVPIKPQN